MFACTDVRYVERHYTQAWMCLSLPSLQIPWPPASCNWWLVVQRAVPLDPLELLVPSDLAEIRWVCFCLPWSWFLDGRVSKHWSNLFSGTNAVSGPLQALLLQLFSGDPHSNPNLNLCLYIHKEWKRLIIFSAKEVRIRGNPPGHPECIRHSKLVLQACLIPMLMRYA